MDFPDIVQIYNVTKNRLLFGNLFFVLEFDLIDLCLPGEPVVFSFQRGDGFLPVCQDPLPGEAFQLLGQFHLNGFVGEVAHNQERLTGALTQVDNHLRMVHHQELEITVNDSRVRLAQGNQLLIIMEYRIEICQGSFRIDDAMVLIHRQPGLTGCKAGIFRSTPLHRSTGIVPGGAPLDLKPLLLRLLPVLVVEIVNVMIKLKR